MRGHSRGFTLIELTVAIAIAVLLGVLMLRMTSSGLRWTALQAQRDAEHAAIGELVDRWRSEEDSAWAIFTPSNDVNGISNSDGHEVDFFTRDAKSRSYFWAYDYDASTQTLKRYLYGTPGGSPVLDRTYAGITGFYAHTYPVTALQDPNSKIYSPLYTGAALQAGSVRFYGAANPLIAGGNQITYMRIAGPTLVRELQLATQTAPSGFTIVFSYTPAPTATPRSVLNAWPQYLELPLQGQALQTSWLPAPRNVAFYLNRVLGGATANAALSPCAKNQARAFTDATFTTPLVNALPPAGAMPAGISGSTDSGGCVTINDAINSNVELYEPGNTSALQQGNTTCSSTVSIIKENPYTAAAANVGIYSQGGTQAIQKCTITWVDQQPKPSSAVVS